MKSLAEIEIKRITWHTLREAGGTAENIPHALTALFEAPTPAAAEEAYWLLENHVVVQGQLFQVAEHVVPVLLSALVDERPRHVRISILELLFQILSGGAHEDEVAQGNGNLAAVCRVKAREGLWVLYQELHQGEHDAARENIEIIEDDPLRLDAFLKDVGSSG